MFAAKLALAGPWGHVPLILAGRNTAVGRMPQLAIRLGVPGWQARMATTLECRGFCVGSVKLNLRTTKSARFEPQSAECICDDRSEPLRTAPQAPPHGFLRHPPSERPDDVSRPVAISASVDPDSQPRFRGGPDWTA